MNRKYSIVANNIGDYYVLVFTSWIINENEDKEDIISNSITGLSFAQVIEQINNFYQNL